MKKSFFIILALITLKSRSQTTFFDEAFVKRPSLVDSIINLMPGYSINKIDSSNNEEPVSYIAYLKKERSEPILIYYMKVKDGTRHVMRNVKIAAPFEVVFKVWKKWIDNNSAQENILQTGSERRFSEGKIFSIVRHDGRMWMLSF